MSKFKKVIWPDGRSISEDFTFFQSPKGHESDLWRCGFCNKFFGRKTLPYDDACPHCKKEFKYNF